MSPIARSLRRGLSLAPAFSVLLLLGCTPKVEGPRSRDPGGGGAPGRPQALYAQASAACASMEVRTTGTIHYFCDCQGGSEATCVRGDDARVNASDNAQDCTSEAAPCRTFATASAVFQRMNGGDTIAFCQGGAFEQAGNTQWFNTRCAAASDMRAPANTTTCDIREYSPKTWSGANKPILRQTSTNADLFQFYTTWTRGIRVLNLDLEGGGTGCGGTVLGRAAIEAAKASDVLVCNDTISRWYLGANNNPSKDPIDERWDFYGNTVVMNSLDAFLGSGDHFTYDANYLEDNGGCNVTSHTIYPAGSNEFQVENVDLRIVNNWIRYVNTTCQGIIISGHGTYDGVLLENNLIQAAGRSTPTCWGMGIAPDSGYTNVVQYEKNLVFRRNWIEGAGWHMINCAACPGAIVENNVIVSTAPAGTAAPLIAVPFGNVRTVQPDPITTGAIIRNNTVYVAPGGSSVAYGIYAPIAEAEGTGYVVANNSIYMPDGGRCFSRGVQPASAYAFVGNNACYGGTYDATPAGTWVTADPMYASAPTDFTPREGSPLIGAGDPREAASLDLYLKPRPAAPSMGAVEP